MTLEINRPSKEEWREKIKPRVAKWFNYAGNDPRAPRPFTFYDITLIYNTLIKYDKNITNEELKNLVQIRKKELEDQGKTHDIPSFDPYDEYHRLLIATCIGNHDVCYMVIEKPIIQGDHCDDFNIQKNILGDAIFDIKIYNATYAYIYRNFSRDGDRPFNKAYVTDMEKIEKQGGCVYEKEVDSLLQFIRDSEGNFILRDNTYENPLFLMLFLDCDMRICTDGDKIECKTIYMNVYGRDNIYRNGHRGRPFIKFPSENRVCVFGGEYTYICSEKDLEHPEGILFPN
jgi:hypothetical protein